MIRWIVLLGAILLPHSEAKAEEFALPHISAYGTSTIQAAPDQMKWALNARNIQPTSMGVAEAHGITVSRVLSFLKQHQIADKTVQTSRMQLSENEIWNPAMQKTVQEGYVASTDIQFTLTDLSQYSPIWMGLSAIPGVRVRTVELDHTDRIRIQNESRTQAVLAARDKARAIAETLGVRLGDPLSIEEDLSAADPYVVQTTNSRSNVSSWIGDSAGGNQIAPGTIPIRARVKATFRILEK